MRLVDGIIFTLANTVICIALPKLLSMVLHKRQPQGNLPKKPVIASVDAHITEYTEYIDVAPERVKLGVGSSK